MSTSIERKTGQPIVNNFIENFVAERREPIRIHDGIN
jgi:hypothetical protein